MTGTIQNCIIEIYLCRKCANNLIGHAITLRNSYYSPKNNFFSYWATEENWSLVKLSSTLFKQWIWINFDICANGIFTKVRSIERGFPEEVTRFICPVNKCEICPTQALITVVCWNLAAWDADTWLRSTDQDPLVPVYTAPQPGPAAAPGHA